ncbi:hypothetical protein FQZ97_959740 [compost metagenome]
MSTVILRIQLPDKRIAGPQSSHQRIFATHEIQVARPEQLIEPHLVLEGEGMQAFARRPGRGGATVAQDLHCGRGTARGDQPVHRRELLCRLKQRHFERLWFVAEQAGRLYAQRNPHAGAPCCCMECAAPLLQAWFAQQPTRGDREPWEDEPLAQALQRAAHDR